MGKYNEKYFGGEHESYDAEQLLTEGESILWRAKPKRSAFILGKVFRMLPVALLWLLFDGGFIAALITTGAFVPLVLGFFWRRGNSRGALASMLAGLCYSFYNLFATLGLPLPMFWKTQTLLQTGLGVGLSLCVYIGVSLLTPAEYEKADTFMKGLSRERAVS